MKNKFSALLVALLTFSFATSSFAQYDDLYSIPSDDNEVAQYQAEEEYVAYEASDDYDEYSYLDDQDYYYSSRIRRFNRSNTGFGYYSPFYTDAAFYNRAFSPGVSIYLGNPYSYSAARVAARNPFLGFGSASAFSPFYNPYNTIGFNRGFGGGFNSFNSGFGGASSFNAYCPPTSYGSSLVRTVRGSNNNTFGPRGTSTINSSSRSNDSSVRRGTSRVIRSAQTNDGASSRSRSTSTRANTNTRSNSRTYDRSSRRSSRSTATPRSNRRSSTRSSSSRSSSRSFSAPRSSSRSSSIRSSSSSRRQ